MRVMVADDQPDVRSALRLLLEQALSLDVAAEARDASTLLSHLESASPDLLLLDWELPGAEPTALVAQLHARLPNLLVLVLSGRPETRQAATVAGAAGFIDKCEPAEVLVAAVRRLVPPADGCALSDMCADKAGG